ncbi:MAG: DMT family transporter [Gammaproteobacteria bacterium]|nr:DMT family transporter [Gammaproteobacteria bacterium]
MRARAYLVLAALLFSTGGTVIKLSTLSGWQIAGLRSGIAALFLAALMPAWRRFGARPLLVGSAYGATMVLFVVANTLTSASSAIFLQSTAPLYVLFLAPLLLREPLRRMDFAVALILATGTALVFLGGGRTFETAPSPGEGNLLGALSGVTWALTVMGLRWLGGRAPANAGAAVVLGNALALLFCLPLALPLTGATPTDWVIVAYLGIVQIGLAYICLVRGVAGTRAFEASLFLLVEPVASTLLAWGIHEEVPGPAAALGSGVIALGLVVQAARGWCGSREEGA